MLKKTRLGSVLKLAVYSSMVLPFQVMEEEGAPWELLYNLGTALVQRGAAGDDAAAESCLEQAEEVCREVHIADTTK